MRILVLEEGRLLAWMVEQICPPGTEVLGVECFDEARRILLEDPPDAVVICMKQARLPWNAIQQICARRRPPIPVLYQSCEHPNAEAAGLDPAVPGTWFLQVPAKREELSAALLALVAAASPPEQLRAG